MPTPISLLASRHPTLPLSTWLSDTPLDPHSPLLRTDKFLLTQTLSTSRALREFWRARGVDLTHPVTQTLLPLTYDQLWAIRHIEDARINSIIQSLRGLYKPQPVANVAAPPLLAKPDATPSPESPLPLPITLTPDQQLRVISIGGEAILVAFDPREPYSYTRLTLTPGVRIVAEGTQLQVLPPD